MATIKFWGVRGSVAAPITADDVSQKVLTALQAFHASLKTGNLSPEKFLESLPFSVRGTIGGNTSCVEVRCGDERICLDMGTGMRPFGNSLFPQMFENGGLTVTVLLSHVHWDHIQGLPFFGPLHINKETGIKNRWNFYGGTDWMSTAEACLRGQMDAPEFPVSWQEIKRATHEINASSVCDMMGFHVGAVKVKTRKLHHPQETYGWRIEYDGKVIAYSTDNEPYDPSCPDPRLLELAEGADVWITDCQYTKEMYEGKVGGVARHGWGHSYPEAVAETARRAGVKKTVLFHHDPASDDNKVLEIVEMCKGLVGVGQEVVAAYEGMEIAL
ncbi:MBL fold metallo-hydrolase [bacterium]|nr:MBL fold metallo-hydrolase [bacterium]|tara:strand:+ start:33143 stop:34129 length:987 start_codon:yes stop_codon:yes gene_type:complete